jgi:hypothetical protein
MEVLGRPLTWRTSCFIDPECGAEVFGHTNGHGDFVLLDELGFPWPVHACYLRRFELSPRANILKIRATRETYPTLEFRGRHWDQVILIQATADRYWEDVDVVATVTHVEESFISRPQFRTLTPHVKARLHDQIHRSRAAITLVTGDGEEYLALIDLQAHRVRFNDVIAATLKVKPLLDTFVFVVTKSKRFRSS